jgi:DNA-binding SARP family transcriptional activator/Tfp pilus assembly protein PilF
MPSFQGLAVSTGTSMIELRVLGTLAIQPLNGGGPVAAVTQPKRLALLLYLALAEPSGPHSRESLMALLWPEADAESTRHSLRNTLYGLRQALGDGAIVARGEGYIELDPAAIRCDAVEVRALLAAQRWKDALAAWGGDLAPGFHVSGAPEFERWLDDQRAALRRTVADVAWRRVDEMERIGEPGVGEAARRAWVIDPTNEAGARRLLQLLDATAGRAAALRAYDDLVEYLRREYDTAPSAATRALAERLNAPVPTPPVSPPVAAMSASPGIPPAAAAALPGVAPAVPRTRQRPVVSREALVAAAILVAIGGSIAALQSPGSVRSAAPAEREALGAPADDLPLPPRYRADTAAYGSYLRGLSLRFQGNYSASLDTFAALVDRAPLYPPGLSGLAHAYGLFVLGGETPPSEGVPKAEEAARRAIALDSTSASAYLLLGGVEMSWRWNLPLARKLIDHGIALDPGDAEAHIVRATWFRWNGQLDSAFVEAQLAHRMDPLNAGMSAYAARQLYFLRRFGEAEAMYRQIQRDYPGHRSNGGLISVYRAEGRFRDALDLLRADLEEAGDSAAAARLPVATSDTQAARAFADRARRNLQRLAESVRRGDLVTPGDWMSTYADLGDADETLRWLDSMLAYHDLMLVSVPVAPSLDFLRNDPRYRAWEAKLPWRHPAR